MSDLMLKQFEAWAVIDNRYSIARTYTDLRYDDDDTEDAWYAWQSSRDSLVIELPESVTNSGTAYIETIRAFIEKQGIKTK